MKHVTSNSKASVVGIAASLLASGLLTSCSSHDDPGELATSMDGILVADSTVMWSTSTIPVCFEQEVDPDDAAAVRRGAGKWEAVSALEFTGWGRCAYGADGIRILVADLPSKRSSSILGAAIDGRRNGMKIHKRTPAKIAMSAAHEFGHAIGFSHEQNREDAPDPRQVPNPDCLGESTTQGITIGAWDLDSIMNYCNPRWNGDGNLSATDARAARHFYGK